MKPLLLIYEFVQFNKTLTDDHIKFIDDLVSYDFRKQCYTNLENPEPNKYLIDRPMTAIETFIFLKGYGQCLYDTPNRSENQINNYLNLVKQYLKLIEGVYPHKITGSISQNIVNKKISEDLKFNTNAKTPSDELPF